MLFFFTMYSAMFVDKKNQETLAHAQLVRETKAHMPDAPSSLIKGNHIVYSFVLWFILLHFIIDAAKTYFISIAGLSKMKSSGKYKEVHLTEEENPDHEGTA